MKKILLGITSLSLIGLSIPLIATSCSTEAPTFGSNLKTSSFTSIVKQNSKAGEEVNIVDANINVNAEKMLKEGFFSKQNFTVADLQNDFTKVLSDFYEVYELETGDTEVELQSIKVNSEVTTPTNTNKNREFNITVFYTVETDSTDQEKVESKDITWELKPSFINTNEIKGIKDSILGANTSNNNIDLKDLKEFFLGEKDADEDDDIGVFDKVSALNKQENLNNSGVLVGYGITLNDIWKHLVAPKRQTITADTVFVVPSISVNTFLKPTTPPTRSYELNTANVLKIKKADFLTAFAAPMAPTATDFNKFFVDVATSIFVTPLTAEETAKIKDISAEALGDFVKITISWTDTKEIPVAFGIPSALFAPEVVVPPTPNPTV
ncbi:MAG: Vmc-like lipoprotein signal peptide domain-containing protein [Metamycoplasmataceae bacterium]